MSTSDKPTSAKSGFDGLLLAARASLGGIVEARKRLESAIDGEPCTLLLLRLRDTACALAVAERDLRSIVDAARDARLSACRGCGRLLDPANEWLADGCPCNSARGVNHGLVKRDVCTCPECDPLQTGASRAVKRG